MPEFQIILTNMYNNISGQIHRENEVRNTQHIVDGVHHCGGREEAEVRFSYHKEIIVRDWSKAIFVKTKECCGMMNISWIVIDINEGLQMYVG